MAGDTSVFGGLNTQTPEGRAKARANLLSGNPDDAMRNAMLDVGINPYVKNPFIQMQMRGARGLSLANAMTNRNMTPDQIAQAGGEGAILQQFMQDALRNGSVFQDLAQSGAQVPGLLNELTQRANSMAEGGITAGQANPFLELLGDAFMDPNNATGALSALYGPTLGPGLGRAYQSQIGDIMDSQMRNLAGDPDTYTPGKARNFWEYIFQRVAPGSNAQRRPGAPSSTTPPARATSGGVE